MYPVSVIITIYKVEKFLNKCIESILSQTFVNFECILVNDCSPDKSLMICEQFKNKDNRIKVIQNVINMGLPQSRKNALSIASGNYVMFIDGDDWIEPDTIEKMYNLAIKENYDIIDCGIYRNTINEQTLCDLPIIYDKLSIIKQILVYGPYATSVCNKLVKKEIYDKVKFPEKNYIEDRVITIQTIYYSNKIEYMKEGLYHYRKNPESLCEKSSQNTKYIDEYQNLLVIENFIKEVGIIEKVRSEISYRANSLKLSFIKNKELRNNSVEVFNSLYPESMKNILITKSKMLFINRFILFLALKNKKVLYIFIDFILLIELSLRKIYKLIIPFSFREKIWLLIKNRA